MNKLISVTVNGETIDTTVPIRLLLVDFLRDHLGLTGTHVGCSFEGVCGACTVHLDDRPIKSCLMLAVQADGCTITTVEGLERDGKLHRLQEAFNDGHALQCGYCTPGILMNATAFLIENTAPTDEEIRHALVGNLCRCTGYVRIVAAIQNAAAQMRLDKRQGAAR